MSNWSASSWQKKPCFQQIDYPNNDELQAVLNQLAQNPPLVTVNEIHSLKAELASACLGKRFILQGGDCAESFTECTAKSINQQFQLLLQMSLVLLHGMRQPVTKIGRIAGQYAKPRSQLIETKGNISLPSYRGDLINQSEFCPHKRAHDPKRLLQGYAYSAMSLNYLRTHINSGFSHLYDPKNWDTDFIAYSNQAKAFNTILAKVHDSIDLMTLLNGLNASGLNSTELYTSHEALHLHYEQALTRQHMNGQHYALSTHYPWLGMRTNQVEGAHIEYLRGIANPIAVKIGPNTTRAHLARLIDTLNPANEPGRLTFITRFGYDAIQTELPPLIEQSQAMGAKVLWICDPMHGNTQTTQTGIKTRNFTHILSELKTAFNLHRTMGSHLGGVHLELTGEHVTECTGGARQLRETDLSTAYKSLVDPRLNHEQALEIVLQIVEHVKTSNIHNPNHTELTL